MYRGCCRLGIDTLCLKKSAIIHSDVSCVYSWQTSIELCFRWCILLSTFIKSFCTVQSNLVTFYSATTTPTFLHFEPIGALWCVKFGLDWLEESLLNHKAIPVSLVNRSGQYRLQNLQLAPDHVVICCLLCCGHEIRIGPLKFIWQTEEKRSSKLKLLRPVHWAWTPCVLEVASKVCSHYNFNCSIRVGAK